MKRQKSHYQSDTEIGYATAKKLKKLLPQYRHKISPHRFTWPQLAASILMTFYLDCSYRDMEDWLLVSDKICHTLEIQEAPDHSTLCRAFHRLGIPALRGMQRLLIQKAIIQEVAIGIDTTGFRTDQASAIIHFETTDPKKTGAKVLMRSEYLEFISKMVDLGTNPNWERANES